MVENNIGNQTLYVAVGKSYKSSCEPGEEEDIEGYRQELVKVRKGYDEARAYFSNNGNLILKEWLDKKIKEPSIESVFIPRRSCETASGIINLLNMGHTLDRRELYVLKSGETAFLEELMSQREGFGCTYFGEIRINSWDYDSLQRVLEGLSGEAPGLPSFDIFENLDGIERVEFCKIFPPPIPS